MGPHISPMFWPLWGIDFSQPLLPAMSASGEWWWSGWRIPLVWWSRYSIWSANWGFGHSRNELSSLDPASPISKVEFQPWKWKRRWSDVRSLAWTGPMLIIITITIWVSKNGIPARIMIIIYLLINVSHFLQPPITQVLNKITPLFWVWPRIGGRHAGYGTQGADHPVTRCPPLCHYLPHCFASFAVLVSWGTWSSQVHWPHIDCCVCSFSPIPAQTWVGSWLPNDTYILIIFPKIILIKANFAG